MKLAINYSQPAADLVRSAKIEVDYFKTPDWNWMIEEANKLKPVAVHFTLEVGNGNLESTDLDRVFQLQDLTHTPFVNFHLDSRGCYYPEIRVDSIKKDDTERIKKAILSELESMAGRIGADRMILENSPYRGEEGSTMRVCVEADLITSIIDEIGCGLLLDISHALITCKTIRMEPEEYFNRLPVHMLKELHFAGIHRNALTGLWMDHLSIQENDWLWLEWVLKRIKDGDWCSPWLLAFEYGGVGEPFEWRTDPQVIAEQVPLLYDRVHKLNN